jgi:putative sigma-54 modulation protein
MKLNIFGHETILTEDIKKYASHKMEKLDKFDRGIIGVDLTLEENHHGKNKKVAFLAKGLVKIPGRDISAEATDKTLFAAIDDLENKLSAQLRKSKDKLVNKSKFSQSKEFLRKFIGK